MLYLIKSQSNLPLWHQIEFKIKLSYLKKCLNSEKGFRNLRLILANNMFLFTF